MQEQSPQQLKARFEALHRNWVVSGADESVSRVQRFLHAIDYAPSLQATTDLATLDLELLQSKYEHFYNYLVRLWKNCQAVHITDDEALTTQFRQLGELVWYSYP